MSRIGSRILPLLAVLAAFVLSAAPTRIEASASQGIVAGIGVRVLNEAGKLVPGAHVALKNADGKVVAHRMTNKLGRCFFHPVKPGDYTVLAARPGMGKGLELVSVEQGEHAKVTVNLKKQ